MTTRSIRRCGTSAGATLLVLVLAAPGAAAAQETGAQELEALRLQVTGQVPAPQVLTVRPREPLVGATSLTELLGPGAETLLGTPRGPELRIVPVTDPGRFRELLPGAHRRPEPNPAPPAPAGRGSAPGGDPAPDDGSSRSPDRTGSPGSGPDEPDPSGPVDSQKPTAAGAVEP